MNYTRKVLLADNLMMIKLDNDANEVRGDFFECFFLPDKILPNGRYILFYQELTGCDICDEDIEADILIDEEYPYDEYPDTLTPVDTIIATANSKGVITYPGGWRDIIFKKTT